ncbi:DsrE family protein [Pseudaminobacter salicylatoxidans]|uniref:DsrE family protein n=1 Tax=Pseudaminobacter salicylatoxidans TaxID=93369 RepID=UPI0002F4B609|nr:DsrE family protein [Pseudaminobacter salicylatoxidans]
MNVKTILAAGCMVLGSSLAHAGPDDPSKFEAVQYGAQKFVYDFNFATPQEGLGALGFIRNHIKALKEFGDFEKSRIVIVAHGNELHAFSRENKAAFPEAYAAFKELTDQGVEIHICRNAAKSRGYDPDGFYDVMTVVPAAVIDIARYAGEGYGYIYPAQFAKVTREEIVAQYPEVDME